jgi:hypothetical protein
VMINPLFSAILRDIHINATLSYCGQLLLETRATIVMEFITTFVGFIQYGQYYVWSHAE